MFNNLLYIAALLLIGSWIGYLAFWFNQDHEHTAKGQPSRYSRGMTKLRVIVSIIWSEQMFVVTNKITSAQITDLDFVNFVHSRIDSLIPEDVRTKLEENVKHDADKWSIHK